MTPIALGIPHTPWIPARVSNMERLRSTLGIDAAHPPCSYREFTDREPNSSWSERMWSWLADTRSDWCLTLQDDVELAPCFWPALHAMLATLDDAGATICGLSSVHPIQVEMARQGHRWFRTRAWIVGWAYAIRRSTLVDFLDWRDEHPQQAHTVTEDSLLNQFCSDAGVDVWHPIPTIVDHDTTLDSTYANDQHVHRRPWITWRDFGEGSLTDRTFWRPGGPPDSVPLLPVPTPRMCWACGAHQGDVGTDNGLIVCRFCVAQMAGAMITRGK